MPTFLNRYATPLTTGLFLVSALSGIALFFHWNSAAFHGMHEWLSLALLIPFAVHVWKNWTGIVVYFHKKTLVLPLVLSLLVAVPFAVPALTSASQGNPARIALRLLETTPLEDLAPILKKDPAEITSDLREMGYVVSSSKESLRKVATVSDVDTRHVLYELILSTKAQK